MLRPRLGALRAWSRTGAGQRKLRYVAASVLSAVAGQFALLVAFGGLRWSAASAAVFSFTVGALASYHLNRMWVWERAGRSSLLREVIPFWVLAGVGLALSTAMVVLAEHVCAQITSNHGIRTLTVMVASVVSVLPVWLLKYLVLDRFVFVLRVESQG